MSVRTSRRLGFTMVEMIFVTSIIGILAGFALPRYLAARRSAEVVTLAALVQRTRIAVLDYESKNGGSSGDLAMSSFGEVPPELAAALGTEAFSRLPGGVGVAFATVEGTPLGSPGRLLPTLVFRSGTPTGEALLQQFLREYQGAVGGTYKTALLVPIGLDGSGGIVGQSGGQGGGRGGGAGGSGGGGGGSGGMVFTRPDSSGGPP